MKVVIAGSGLVGSLLALILGNDGHEVHVFEYRNDPRKGRYEHGRSINLALSTRGRRALAAAGLEDVILKNAIPMKGRMLHDFNGNKKEVPYDPIGNQCVYSVSRHLLNNTLLTEAETCPNVKIMFNHKLIDANLDTGNVKILCLTDNKEMEINADLIVGADGAFSIVRKSMLKRPMINFSQTYIEHGYMELIIPQDYNGNFIIEKNYLHIWPRNEFMLIALPNQDSSFTATLFMPFEMFDKLKTEELVEEFFKAQFPDAVELIGKEKLLKTFMKSKPSSLVSITCNPHHLGKGVLIGDAAHAMVPFYGQGMNAGFEDVLVLNQILQNPTNNKYSIEELLELYSKARVEDTHAICKLAMYNYIEMRHHVNQKSYYWRRHIDFTLHKLLGNGWIPLYNSVTFTTMPYSKCISNKKWQDEVLTNLKGYASTAMSGCVIASLFIWNIAMTYNLLPTTNSNSNNNENGLNFMFLSASSSATTN